MRLPIPILRGIINSEVEIWPLCEDVSAMLFIGLRRYDLLLAYSNEYLSDSSPLHSTTAEPPGANFWKCLKQEEACPLNNNTCPHAAKSLGGAKDVLRGSPAPGVLAYHNFSASCTFRLLLFKNLKQHARRRNFDIQNQLDNDMEHFFLSQPHKFYAAAIQRPPECRRLVTDSDGDYSLD